MSSAVTATEITGRTANQQEPGVAARRRGRAAERMREQYQRRLVEGVCVECGQPRGEDGTKLCCRPCASRKAARSHEERQRLVSEGRCWRCGGSRSEGGTQMMCARCAIQHRTRDHELRQRRIAEGLCRDCGQLRGEDGTSTRCQYCLDKRAAGRLERSRRLNAEGLCCKCGGPLDDGGTQTMCAHCASLYAARSAEVRRNRVESGICPQHGVAMPMLELCPACRYEQPGGVISDLTFEGLLPRPRSGDRLESCVGCKRCGRMYHQDGYYCALPIPSNLKLRDEHIGEEGCGIWLLFSQEDEEGTPVKYERCSTPEKECVGKISGSAAMDYLAQHRRGKALLGTCHRHALSTRFLLAATEARIRHQLGAAAQPQNGDVHADDERVRKFREAVDAVAEVWDVVKGGNGTVGHRLKKVDLLEIGAALGVPLDRDDDVKSRNRVTRKLKSLGAYDVYPAALGGSPAFVKAVAEAIEGGATRDEITLRLWKQHPA